ncbi:MAG: nuclear transport factor 2 family protein [Chitinophagales bacterium]|nr:nuclear transport factor 2 family protein [Chitinophagales bacterium]
MKKLNFITPKDLLDTYYKGFAQKQGWEAVISDDFKFVGGDMSKTEPIVGKQAYIDIIKRFSQLFQNMRPKQMIIDGDNACGIENYDYIFPNGKAINGDVATIWKVKNNKLDALTIFFDTIIFQVENLKRNNLEY